MRFTVILFTALFFLACGSIAFLKGQSGHLQIGAGAAYSTAVNGRTAGTALTPFAYVKADKHEGILGLDIYQQTLMGKVLGFQATYRYFTWFSTKTVKFFADATIQYHKFSKGDGPAVPFNFSPRDSLQEVLALLRTKSFVNVYGAGLDMRLGKRIGVQFTVSAGFNFSKSEYSPSNDEHNTVNLYPPGSKVKPIAFGWLAAYYRFYMKEKREAD